MEKLDFRIIMEKLIQTVILKESEYIVTITSKIKKLDKWSNYLPKVSKFMSNGIINQILI